MHMPHEQLSVEGFLEVAYGAQFPCPEFWCVVDACLYEYHRKPHRTCLQLLKQLKAVHARHPYIRNEARC